MPLSPSPSQSQSPFDLSLSSSDFSSRTFVTVAVGAVIALSALAYTYFATPDSSTASDRRSGSGSSKKSSSKSSSNSNSNSNRSSNSKSSSTVVDTSDASEGGSETFRGYKSLDGGRKTSYFHRELSAEEKKILGDCSPKQIDPNSGNAVDSQNFSPRLIQRSDSGPSSLASSSLWNSAGTFEEKNINEWSHATIKSLFKDIIVVCADKYEGFDSVRVVVTSVSQLSGDSVIINSRGKKKYIYDLTAELSWRLTASTTGSSASVTIEGAAIIHEITADLSQETNFTLTSARTDLIAQSLYNIFIRGSKSKYNTNLNNAIKSTCTTFYDSLKLKY
jgi:hypothetical protein